MSESRQPNDDLLEEAIHAFQQTSVPERPLDCEILAKFGSHQVGLPQPSSMLVPRKRRYLMHVVLSSAAAAMLLLGALALFWRNGAPQEPVQVAATTAPGKSGDVAAAPPLTREALEREGIGRPSKRESLGLGSFGKDVRDAEVIVVGTALDWAPAPPHAPGDLPEVLLRFQVKRVLKGELTKKEITTRTPTAAAEFIGKDWIILLTPQYMAGKYEYASHINIKLEPTVKSYLPDDDE
jgi:hypothetical protein